MRFPLVFGCGAAALLFASGAAVAQQTLDQPVGEVRFYALDSGVLANPTDQPMTVFTDFVQIEDSAWLRLYFDEVALDRGSFIRITSARDGEVQELDALGVYQWSETSAYFNGDTVFVDLVAGPHTDGNRIVLDRVLVEFPVSHTEDQCGICGEDDRYRTNEPFAGRLVSPGCTATIFTERGCLVSAGHCASRNQVVEFNVPDSNPDCSLNHPPIEDQFPIVEYDFQDGGLGLDWAVMIPGKNSLGENAFEHQQALRRIRAEPIEVESPIDIWGFAVDDDCILNQTQQHSPGGRVTGYATYVYQFTSDVTFGNSGSAIIYDGEIVGVVTHCGIICPNYGTGADLPAFAEARADLCQGLHLTDPVPGLAGQENTVYVAAGTPGGRAWIVYGLETGATEVPGCPGIFVGIRHPTVAGSTDLDSNGDGELSGFVPDGMRTRTVHLQAVEIATCRVSNLVSYYFP